MVGMFEWQKSYITGVGSIDAQHQILFQTATRLHDAMLAGNGKATVGPILDRLMKYTESHFAHEERLMQLYQYPHLAAHKVQHEALARQVRDFQAKFQSGQATITVQLLQFLKGWLVGHIQESDMKCVPFIENKAA
jgi:hemerythrin-like metal-binding protein